MSKKSDSQDLQIEDRKFLELIFDKKEIEKNLIEVEQLKKFPSLADDYLKFRKSLLEINSPDDEIVKQFKAEFKELVKEANKNQNFKIVDAIVDAIKKFSLGFSKKLVKKINQEFKTTDVIKNLLKMRKEKYDFSNKNDLSNTPSINLTNLTNPLNSPEKQVKKCANSIHKKDKFGNRVTSL